MKQQQPTPGPWVWDCTELWSRLMGPDGGPVLTLLSDDPTTTIGLRVKGERRDGPPWEYHPATADHPDARLIALAPAMLSLISGMISALRSYQHGNASPDLAREVADAAEELVRDLKGGG
jgi:hypothetical protein